MLQFQNYNFCDYNCSSRELLQKANQDFKDIVKTICLCHSFNHPSTFLWPAPRARLTGLTRRWQRICSPPRGCAPRPLTTGCSSGLKLCQHSMGCAFFFLLKRRTYLLNIRKSSCVMGIFTTSSAYFGDCFLVKNRYPLSSV